MLPAVAQSRRARALGVQVHYIPVHLQPYYPRLLETGRGTLPAAEAFYDEALSLPCVPDMEATDVTTVVTALAAALAETRPPARWGGDTDADHAG